MGTAESTEMDDPTSSDESFPLVRMDLEQAETPRSETDERLARKQSKMVDIWKAKRHGRRQEQVETTRSRQGPHILSDPFEDCAA